MVRTSPARSWLPPATILSASVPTPRSPACAACHRCQLRPGRPTDRLNRGGDRIANNALWRIVMVRLTCDQRTTTYVARRTAEGMAKRDIIRCLKRYVAREVFHALLATPPALTRNRA